jgi:lipopolysaccharide export LptBFGC system permease protein LptF
MEKEMKNEKVAEFQIQDLLPIAIVFIVIAVAVAYGAQVLGNIQAGFTANTLAYNITGYGLTSLLNLANQLPTLATIVVAAVIIGVIVYYFYQRMAGGGMR